MDPTNHTDASVSLRALLSIFAVLLIAVLGYLVYQQKTVPADTTDYTATRVLSPVDPYKDYTVGKTTVSTTDPEKHTYVNETTGLQFDIPTSWYVLEFASLKELFVQNTNELIIKGDENAQGFSIDYDDSTLAIADRKSYMQDNYFADIPLVTISAVNTQIMFREYVWNDAEKADPNNSVGERQASAFWPTETSKYSARSFSELESRANADKEVEVMKQVLASIKIL